MATLKTIGIIPEHLVQSIGDRGTTEYEVAPGEIEQDDLRIVAELSGGHLLFIDVNQHIMFDDNGNLCVMVYAQDAP